MRDSGERAPRSAGGYLTLFVRLRPGQAVVEVSDGTLSMAAAQPLVVALYRTAFLSGTVVRSWPKRGLPGSK
jgi:hypothetical protein